MKMSQNKACVVHYYVCGAYHSLKNNFLYIQHIKKNNVWKLRLKLAIVLNRLQLLV